MSEIAHQETPQVSSFVPESPVDLQFAPKWFAVYTTPRHEKRVDQHLSMRAIEHYLPLYRTQRKWSDGSKVTLDLPLFPGYIFVRIKRTQRVRVLEVPGVLAVVGGTGGEPASLPEADIDALRSGERGTASVSSSRWIPSCKASPWKLTARNWSPWIPLPSPELKAIASFQLL